MKKITFLLFLLCFSCTPKKQGPPPLQVSLINNGKSAQFKGLQYAVMQEIARDSSNAVWQSLIPVYRMPADTDMKSYQPVQPGSYRVKDSVVVFTPDTPFIKGQTYFVRNYRPGEGAALTDYVKGRARAGKMHFTDLIFKQ
jgi:hypothetical protein